MPEQDYLSVTNAPSQDASSPTDIALLARIQQDDQDALMTLYHRYSRLVYSVAYQTLNNQEDSEETTQDVFLRVWKKSSQYDAARGSFVGWLVTVTRNAAIDRLRVRQRRDVSPDTLSLDADHAVWANLEPHTRDQDLHHQLASALHTLSNEQQEAISLAYFYGMSHSEIAEKLGRPLGTVKSHIRQGMKRLRDIYLSHDG